MRFARFPFVKLFLIALVGFSAVPDLAAQNAQLQWNTRTGAFPAEGGWGSVAVNAESTTEWSLAGLPSWIAAVSGTPWQGSGVASFYVYANTGSAREASITANGETFTIRQAAGTCYTAIAPRTAQYGVSGGERSINVDGGFCSWSVTSTESWLSVNSGGGTGNGAVFYEVAATDQRRSAALLIGSSVFIVDQNGPSCGYYIPSPFWYDHPATGGQGSFDLFANSNCPAWTVSSDSPWVTVHTGGGQGPGTVTYTVEANPYEYAREAVILVNGNPHFVRQRASETPGYVTIQPGKNGFDTSWGSAFYTAGTPELNEIFYGGSGDRFEDYFYFDVGSGLNSANVGKAELWLYVTAKAPTDPHLQLWHLTQPWSEAGVSSTSYPSGVVIRNLAPFQLGWNRIDITDLYKRWRNGTYSNYGVKLAPAGLPYNARGKIATGDNSDPAKHPKIVLTHQEETRVTSLARQKMLQVVGGTGYQVIFFNYDTGVSITSPYTYQSGSVPYEIPPGDWVGLYHYDYASGRFNQAVYNGR